MNTKNTLKITLVQSDLHWENREENLKMFSHKLENQFDTDIIVLPEMFTTGFSMQASLLAEKTQGEAYAFMHTQAQRHQAAIVGSIIAEENGLYYNRLLWVEPDGSLKKYDKRHLFTMADEHQTFNAGTEKIIITWRGWKICPMICYDLRFPVWSRNQTTPSEHYDIVLYVANFPQKRATAWNTLLRARAIENLAFCVGVNRVGIDGKGVVYSGDSAVISPLGEELAYIHQKESIETIALDKNFLDEYRQNFPAHRDADIFTLHPTK